MVPGFADRAGFWGAGTASSVSASPSAVMFSAANGSVTSMLDTLRHSGETVGEYVLYRF